LIVPIVEVKAEVKQGLIVLIDEFVESEVYFLNLRNQGFRQLIAVVAVVVELVVEQQQIN
jgi:hypothetical protein